MHFSGNTLYRKESLLASVHLCWFLHTCKLCRLAEMFRVFFFPLFVRGEGCRPGSFGDALDWPAGVPQLESGVNFIKAVIQPSAEVIYSNTYKSWYAYLIIFFN